jgi:hypothetical protein
VTFTPRLPTVSINHARPTQALCDTWSVDGARLGDELPGVEVIGTWPNDVVVEIEGISSKLGPTPEWANDIGVAAIAQGINERAQLQPLDTMMDEQLHHLQAVCARPRLHLRVTEERVPVGRARRTPVRAIAELVSHPGDWEHRTLRSIQPARVLSRESEDDWNLYENRIAARLVDHLLAYCARRLVELRRDLGTFEDFQHRIAIGAATQWRTKRVLTVWSEGLSDKTRDDLRRTMALLESIQRRLQALLASPLYERVPRSQGVGLSLRSTNILVNDLRYRRVVELWRCWLSYGHKREVSPAERQANRARQARAWDRVVLLVTMRALDALGWQADALSDKAWRLRHPSWRETTLTVDSAGIVSLTCGANTLRLMPACASLAGIDGRQLEGLLTAWDQPGATTQTVIVHVGAAADIQTDRATGWSYDAAAVLLGCSPSDVDSEERVGRLLNGWLASHADHPYPGFVECSGLPEPPPWPWLWHRDGRVAVLRNLTEGEKDKAFAWLTSQEREQATLAERARAARQATVVAPPNALRALRHHLETNVTPLPGADVCPLCDAHDCRLEPRPGSNDNGSDATWWATCAGCNTEWGLRRCRACRNASRILVPGNTGIDDLTAYAACVHAEEWPDLVLGRDVWAQPCQADAKAFRCSACGTCSRGNCARCEQRARSPR